MPSAAQNHWPSVRIGEALDLVNGRAFKPTEWKKTGTPIIRIQNLNKPEAPYNYFEGDLPEKFRVDDGDLLFAWSGTPGTSFGAHIWRGRKAWLNQHIFKVRFDKAQFDKRFLQLAINQNLAEYIRAAHGGAGLAHITKGRFEESELPQPDIPEQRQIVAEIEKQFTRLEAGVAALRRVQSNLRRYRAAVLKAACEGRLVPTEAELAKAENRKFETGDQLLAQILNGRRKNWQGRGKYKEPAAPDTVELPQLPEGWAWARLEQLGLIIGGFTKNPKRAKLPEKLPYLRVANVYANELRLAEIEYIGVEESELAKLLLRRGDLLIVEGNGSKDQIGRLAIWDGSIDPCVHQNHIIKIRTVDGRMPKWILYWLQSTSGRHFVESVASSTSGLYTLSVNKVGDLPIPLPPLAEQSRIAAEVEQRLSIVAQLESVVSAAAARASRFRQSLLKRAFLNRPIQVSL